MILFDRRQIFKKTRSLQKKQPSHFVLEKAAKTIVERIGWRSQKPLQILILGAYSYVFLKFLKSQLEESCQITFVQNIDSLFDSEFIPFSENSFDCIFSFFDLQWINDLPGHLKQLEYCLCPNGIIMGVFLGADSFKECHEIFLCAESKLSQNICMRFHPNIGIAAMADLLARAGFDCPIVDKDSIIISEDKLINHLYALRSLFATNSMIERSNKMHPSILPTLDQKTKVTLDLIYFTALGHIPQKKLEKISKQTVTGLNVY